MSLVINMSAFLYTVFPPQLSRECEHKVICFPYCPVPFLLSLRSPQVFHTQAALHTEAFVGVVEYDSIHQPVCFFPGPNDMLSFFLQRAVINNPDALCRVVADHVKLCDSVSL